MIKFIVDNKRVRIKKCPFCKGKNIKLSTSTNTQVLNFIGIYVECLDCGATGPTAESNIITESIKMAAIKSWNRR